VQTHCATKKEKKKKRLCYNNAEEISMREVSTIKMLLNQELERLRTKKNCIICSRLRLNVTVSGKCICR
jgi:hypothetical protein